MINKRMIVFAMLFGLSVKVVGAEDSMDKAAELLFGAAASEKQEEKPTENFILNHQKSVEEQQKKAAEELEALFNPEAIFLYGLYERGDNIKINTMFSKKGKQIDPILDQVKEIAGKKGNVKLFNHISDTQRNMRQEFEKTENKNIELPGKTVGERLYYAYKNNNGGVIGEINRNNPPTIRSIYQEAINIATSQGDNIVAKDLLGEMNKITPIKQDSGLLNQVANNKLQTGIFLAALGVGARLIYMTGIKKFLCLE
jgi:hypothetical protein